MIDVLEIIKEVSAKNKDAGKSPDYALFEDVQAVAINILKEEINNLIISKKVKHHETLNSFSFEVLAQTENNE